jgi:hypothetical protein
MAAYFPLFILYTVHKDIIIALLVEFLLMDGQRSAIDLVVAALLLLSRIDSDASSPMQS